MLLELRKGLDEHRDRVGHDVTAVLREYFDPKDGRFAERVQRLVEDDGELARVIKGHVEGSDSALAQRVVGYSRRLIALGILALSLFIYFFDNRVTVNPNYTRLHEAMWVRQPVVGAIAAHWTINAQGLLYPFTRKIRPAWLDFDRDPLGWMPLAESTAGVADAPARRSRGKVPS
jgi:hypothetical protein